MQISNLMTNDAQINYLLEVVKPKLCVCVRAVQVFDFLILIKFRISKPLKRGSGDH